MEMSDFSWQHQKYARTEIYVVTHVYCGVRGRTLASHTLVSVALNPSATVDCLPSFADNN